MAPPELARDAPIANIFEPVQEDGALILGNNFDQVFAHNSFRRFRERLHFHEPLRGDSRLDDGFAPVADAHSVHVLFHAFEQAQFFQIRDDAGARGEALKAGVFSGGFVHVAVAGHHVDLGEIVALAYFEVVGIVRRSNFHRTCAELAVNISVGDDRNFAIHQRQHDSFADEALIAFVIRMNGDGGIAEHGFRARGGDYQKFLRAGDG